MRNEAISLETEEKKYSQLNEKIEKLEERLKFMEEQQKNLQEGILESDLGQNYGINDEMIYNENEIQRMNKELNETKDEMKRQEKNVSLLYTPQKAIDALNKYETIKNLQKDVSDIMNQFKKENLDAIKSKESEMEKYAISNKLHWKTDDSKQMIPAKRSWMDKVKGFFSGKNRKYKKFSELSQEVAQLRGKRDENAKEVSTEVLNKIKNTPGLEESEKKELVSWLALQNCKDMKEAEKAFTERFNNNWEVHNSSYNDHFFGKDPLRGKVFTNILQREEEKKDHLFNRVVEEEAVRNLPEEVRKNYRRDARQFVLQNMEKKEGGEAYSDYDKELEALRMFESGCKGEENALKNDPRGYLAIVMRDRKIEVARNHEKDREGIREEENNALEERD